LLVRPLLPLVAIIMKDSPTEEEVQELEARILVRDEYGTIWEVRQSDPLWEEAIKNREGLFSSLPFIKLARQRGDWGWWRIMEDLEKKYPKPILPAIDNDVDLSGMPIWAIPEVEENLAKASAWLSYYLGQLAWVEGELAALEEILRIHRGKVMGDIIRDADKRGLKEVIEAQAVSKSKMLRDGTMRQAHLTSEAKLLRRLVEMGQTMFGAISRQLTLRLGERDKAG